MRQLVEAGRVKPVLDGRCPFEEMAEAHRYVGLGHEAGGVAIAVGRGDKTWRSWKAASGRRIASGPREPSRGTQESCCQSLVSMNERVGRTCLFTGMSVVVLTTLVDLTRQLSNVREGLQRIFMIRDSIEHSR